MKKHYSLSTASKDFSEIVKQFNQAYATDFDTTGPYALNEMASIIKKMYRIFGIKHTNVLSMNSVFAVINKLKNGRSFNIMMGNPTDIFRRKVYVYGAQDVLRPYYITGTGKYIAGDWCTITVTAGKDRDTGKDTILKWVEFRHPTFGQEESEQRFNVNAKTFKHTFKITSDTDVYAECIIDPSTTTYV